MGEVFKRGRVYWIDFYAGSERIRESAKTRVKREADEFLTVRKAEVLQGTFVRERKVTLEELGERFMDYSKLHKRSWKRDDQLLGDLKRFFGNPQLRDISAPRILDFQKARKQEVSNATTNRAVALLKKMFTMAESWGMHHVNPVKRVKFLPETSFNPATLSEEQEAKLVEAAPDYIRDLLVFGLNTGLRRSDLLGLQWDSVDIERREIRLVVKKNQKLHELPLNDIAFAVLSRQKRVSEWVFINPMTKKPVKDVRVALAKTAERAGVAKLNWHMLRHTIATRLLEVTDMVTVQEVLGHQSINTTKRYTHPGKQRKRGAMDLLVKRPSNNNDGVPISANDSVSGVGHNLGTMPRRIAVEENVV